MAEYKKNAPVLQEQKNKYNNSIGNYTIFSDEEQLQNTVSEIEKKFAPKKRLNLLLADSYERLNLDLKRSERVRLCGTELEFAQYSSLDSKFHLHYANFCRDRLCPMCSWRRSYKIFSQVSKIMDVIENDYAFLFLTLTVPNVTASELPAKIDDMQRAFNRLTHYVPFQKAVCGFFRALEVTFNKNYKSVSYGTYHPHFHVILAVRPSYFTSRDYLKRDSWLELWQKAMRDYSITQVDVRRVRDKYSSECSEAVKSLKSAVCEVAKYSVKSSDYIFPDNWIRTDDCVEAFLSALTSRRLVSFGGIFEDVRKQLNIDSDTSDTEDLIHATGEIRPDVALALYKFNWSCGGYKMTSKKINVVIEVDEDVS